MGLDRTNTATRTKAVDDHFPPLRPQTGLDLPALHEALDQHYFKRSLALVDGNAAKAAQLLNISYYAFRRRREKLDL